MLFSRWRDLNQTFPKPRQRVQSHKQLITQNREFLGKILQQVSAVLSFSAPETSQLAPEIWLSQMLTELHLYFTLSSCLVYKDSILSHLSAAPNMKDLSVTCRSPCRSLLLTRNNSPWVDGVNLYVRNITLQLSSLAPVRISVCVGLSVTLCCFYIKPSRGAKEVIFLRQVKNFSADIWLILFFFFTCLFCQSEAIFLFFLCSACSHQAKHPTALPQVPKHAHFSPVWGFSRILEELSGQVLRLQTPATSCD